MAQENVNHVSSLGTVENDEFENFCTRMRQGDLQESSCRESAPNTGFDVGDLLKTVNLMLEQNKQLVKTLSENSSQNNNANFHILPDLTKSIPKFNGEGDAKIWIESLKTSALMHRWPDSYTLETAKASLEGGAKKWFQARLTTILSFNDFEDVFRRTFIREEGLAQKWKKMSERVQKKGEPINDYFHDKYFLCNVLNLCFTETKEQIAIGLYSRDQCSNMMSRTHFSPDDLLHDLLEFERVESCRIERMNKRPTQLGAQPTQPMTKVEKSGNSTSLETEIRCFNCNEKGHYASSCPKPKRVRGSCYLCGSTDHKHFKCPKKASSTVSHIVDVIKPLIPCYTVPIECEYGKFDAVIDTGSPISLLLSKFVPEHVKLEQYNNVYTFEGLNQSKLNVLGRLKQKLLIDNCEIELDFFIVPNETVKCDCLLGRDFLSNDLLEIKLDKTVTIKSRVDNPVSHDLDPCDNEIFKIDFSYNSEPDLKINGNLCFNDQQLFREAMKQHYFMPERPEEPQVVLEMELMFKDKIKPIYFNPRRLSFSEKQAVTDIINDLMERKIIRPSTSQFGSPIVLVKKKNGQYRMAVDYRELNKQTLRDNFPIPRIDDQIDNLRDKVYFTSLDLKDAFHHIRMQEDSVQYTAFVTFLGQFEYVKMPFGLSGGPSVFMRFINLAFRELLISNEIQIYLDDILIATRNIEEHLIILKKVLDILVKNKLELRIEKCEFLTTEINYLGYCINADGIRPNQQNVDAVLNYPIPTTFRQLHSFLGLVSYFRRFIKNFSLIAKPLYDMLKKNVDFTWSVEMSASFDQLKSILISQPVLSIYDHSAETELHCDASSHEFGSVLLQKQTDGKFHPIAYFSKRTSVAESKYHSFELEALAIVSSLERFRVYLHGIHFKIVTDCNSLKLTLEKKDINPRIMRWSLLLRNYDYELEHRVADRMKHADALSRHHSIQIIMDNDTERNLILMQTKDPIIGSIRMELESSESKLFELSNGIVYRKGATNQLLFYVPQSMESHVISEGHNSVAHQGVDKTFEYVSRVYWFPKLREKIKTYIRNCLKCIAYSPKYGKQEGELICPDKGSIPFKTLHIDHYGPLEKSKRHRYLFEIIDAFSKFVRLYPTVSTGTDEVIKHLKMYFQTYSRPVRIIADRGSSFRSEKFRDFLQEENVQLVLIATGTPRANGQIERINRSITPMLANLSEDATQWEKHVHEVEFALNNSINRSIGCTPSQLLFGVDQTGKVTDNLRRIIADLNDEERNLKDLRNHAVLKMKETSQKNKNYYDKRHKRSTKYHIGDYVMIRNVDVTPGVNKKLLPKFKGPFVIEKELDLDRYIVKDVENCQLTQRPFTTVVGPDQMRLWVSA